MPVRRATVGARRRLPSQPAVAEPGGLERARQLEGAIELVPLSVRLHPAVVLRHAPASEQPGFPGITGLGVDLHPLPLRSTPGRGEKGDVRDAARWRLAVRRANISPLSSPRVYHYFAQMQDVKDITIIGAGPTGLFGAFYAGMRGASCRLIDNLDQLGS